MVGKQNVFDKQFKRVAIDNPKRGNGDKAMTKATQFKTILRLSTAVLVTGLFALPQSADAHSYTYQQGYQHHQQTQGVVRETGVTIMDHFTTQINAMQLAIVEALRLQTGQLSGNIKEQTAATHNLADLQDDRMVAARIENARYQAMIASQNGNSACNVITSAMVGGSQDAWIARTRESLAEAQLAFDQGAPGTPSAFGRGAAIEARLNRHCEIYATQADVEAGLCERVASDSTISGANLSARKSLFAANTYSPAQQAAALDFMNNAFSPRPQAALPAGFARTPQGREIAAARNANTARGSIGWDVVNDVFARRTGMAPEFVSTPDGKQPMKDWAEATAAKVIGYAPSNNFPNGVSWQDWYELRSRAWYQDPEWSMRSQGGDEVQAIKDMAAMMSFLVYQNYQNYLEFQKMNTILAAQLTILSETTRNMNAVPGAN
jgi:hypothetical protein